MTVDGEEKKFTSPVSGTVTDQSASPVDNATVTVFGSQAASPTQAFDQFDGVQQDVIPEAWTNQAESFALDSTLENADEVPLLVQQGLPGSARGSGDVGLFTLDMERLVSPASVRAGEPLTVVPWDPDGEGFVNIEDTVDRQLPGARVYEQREIVFEKLTPGGLTDRVTDRLTVSTREYGGEVFAREVQLTSGFYRVSYADGSGQSYLIRVGSPLKQALADFRRTVNDTLTQQSQQIQDYVDQGTWTKTQATTGPDGNYSVDVPSGVSAVTVQARKAPDLPDGISFDALTEAYANGTTNASLFLPTRPRQVEVPTGDADITLREVSFPSTAPLDRFQNLTALLSDYFDNASLSRVKGLLKQRLDFVAEDRLNQTYQRLQDLKDENTALEDRAEQYLERLSDASNPDLDINASDVGVDQLQTRVQALEQALQTVNETIAVRDAGGEIAQEAVSRTFVVDGVAIDDTGVSVVADWANGTTTPVSDEYVSVEQSTTTAAGLGQTTIRVSNYPLGEADPSALQLRVQAAAVEGVGEATSEPIDNPLSDVTPPGLEYVSLSSSQPGPDEQVRVSIAPDDSTEVKNITDVTVYGPDAETISSTQIDATSARFTTAGQGLHQARVTYQDFDGNEFVVPVDLIAGDQSRDSPATIRAATSPAAGQFAIVSDGLEGGAITTDRQASRVTVTAQVGEETPSQLHVYTRELSLPPNADLRVQTTQADGQTVTDRTAVKLHLPPSDSETLFWYQDGDNAEPLSAAGFGTVQSQANQTLVVTATDADGTVTISRSTDPGIVERISYSVQETLSGLSIPSLPLTAPLPGLLAALVGVVGLPVRKD